MAPVVNFINYGGSPGREEQDEKQKEHEEAEEGAPEGLPHQFQPCPIYDEIAQNDPNHSVQGSRGSSFDNSCKARYIHSQRKDVSSNAAKDEHY